MKVIPEKTGFRIYVVWDWEVSVKAGIFSAYKSDDTYKIVTDKAILEACNVGWEMSADDAYKMFPELKK